MELRDTVRRARSRVGREATIRRPRRRQIAVSFGNCQAAPLGTLLAASPTFADRFELVPIPAVHLISSRERRWLARLLGVTSLLVAHPVKHGYRGLALGLDELTEHLPSRAEVIRSPPLYWDAMFPFAVVVRAPGRTAIDAPITGHHDLRMLVSAARGDDDDAARRWFERSHLTPGGLSFVRDRAESTLRERERSCDVQMLSFIKAPENEARAFNTYNHPRGFVLEEVARQVHAHLGLQYTPAGGPRPEPLDSVRIPVESSVLQTLGLEGEGTANWVISGRPVSRMTVLRAHLTWYREHPEVVRRGMEEHAERLAGLGLSA